MSPGLCQRRTGDRDRLGVGAVEQQQPHGQGIGGLGHAYVRPVRGEEVTGVGHALLQQDRADPAHLDPAPARGVAGVGALGDHVHVGGAAECRVRVVGSDDGGGMDAEHRHDAVERPGLIGRQFRGGEGGDDLEAVQLRGARQYVTDQRHPQVYRADPGAGAEGR